MLEGVGILRLFLGNRVVVIKFIDRQVSIDCLEYHLEVQQANYKVIWPSFTLTCAGVAKGRKFDSKGVIEGF